MQQIALIVSATTFFIMALVGMTSGQTVFSCSVRAIIGAIVSYIAASIAMKFAVDVMIKAVVQGDEVSREEEKDNGEQTG